MSSLQVGDINGDSVCSKQLEDFLMEKVLHYEIILPEERRSCATLLSRKYFRKTTFKKEGIIHAPSNSKGNIGLIIITNGTVHATSVGIDGIQTIDTTFHAVDCIGAHSVVFDYPLTLSYPGGEISQTLIATKGTTVFMAKKEMRSRRTGYSQTSSVAPLGSMREGVEKKESENSIDHVNKTYEEVSSPINPDANPTRYTGHKGRSKTTLNYKDSVAVFRRSLEKFAHKELVHFVEELSFLGNLSNAKRHEIARCLVDQLQFIVKERGDFVYKRGDVGTSMFFVWSGSIAISVMEKLVADFRVGSFFGETAVLLQDHVREADALASSRCLLLTLPREAIPLLKAICPDQIDSSFGLSMKIQSGQILQNLNMTLLSGFDSTRISLMMHFFNVIEFKADEVLYKEGAECDLFRIITSGQVECTFNGHKSLKNPGEYLGEIFILLGKDHRWATTVRTTTNCTFLQCSYDDLERFCELEPQVKAEFELKLYGSVCKIESILNHRLSRVLFGQHLKKELASENLNFWMAVEAIKREKNSMLKAARDTVVLFDIRDDAEVERDKKEDTLQADAWTLISIYNHFIADSGKEQVNIAGKLRERIDQAYKNDNLELSLLEEARNEIVRLMSRDNFARFKKSDRMKLLMEQIKPHEDVIRKEVCSKRAQTAFRKACKKIVTINNIKNVVGPRDREKRRHFWERKVYTIILLCRKAEYSLPT